MVSENLFRAKDLILGGVRSSRDSMWPRHGADAEDLRSPLPTNDIEKPVDFTVFEKTTQDLREQLRQDEKGPELGEHLRSTEVPHNYFYAPFAEGEYESGWKPQVRRARARGVCVCVSLAGWLWGGCVWW